MGSSKYVEIFKDLISNQVKQDSQSQKITPKYYEDLFPIVKDKANEAIVLFGHPTIDEKTLLSYYNTARRIYTSLNPITIEKQSALTKSRAVTWLSAERKAKIKWSYSERYFHYLEKNRSSRVVKETEDSSSEILGKLGDPDSPEKFYVKGLVVGEVQSGKTGNFNAVINRAVDSGYRLVIIFSGIMEDLRVQTQNRVEEDVIGIGTILESGTQGKKGVGLDRMFGQDGGGEVLQVTSITSCKSDFKTSALDMTSSLNQTNILVCKKNISIIKNLIEWLHDALESGMEKHTMSMLLIDDEADNASLNNLGAKGKEFASKVNAYIRALLELFDKKTYLGYTASPFANVLQDRNESPSAPVRIKIRKEPEREFTQVDNLFPDDFIVLLESPSNYIGAKQIFETVEPIQNKSSAKLPLLNDVNDNVEHFPTKVFRRSDGEVIGVENYPNQQAWNSKVREIPYLDFYSWKEYKKATSAALKEDNFPTILPASLREAILCFILSIAVRESRKPLMMQSGLYQPHNSMLVHVSRYIYWQNTTAKLIKECVRDLVNKIKSRNGDQPIFHELEKVWRKNYATIVENIQDYLPDGYIDDFMSPIVFDSIKSYLPDVIDEIEVVAINSSKDGSKLKYDKSSPKKVIAIGGNTLSRGFTLEGLVINYFIRATNYSDTLLQMGRWFGYKPGYLDCCKIFTTQDSIDKFNLTTRTIEELEHTFRKMTHDPTKTPHNFVIRVKKHPGALQLTRPSIMKNSKEVKWSYQDQQVMTTEIDISPEKLTKVWNSFKQNIAPFFQANIEKNNFLTCKVQGEEIINILEHENNFPEIDTNGMIKFIKLCQKQKKLINWTIAIKKTGDATADKGKGILTAVESKLPVDINLTIRRGPKSEGPWQTKFLTDFRFKVSGASANITSPKDMAVLLSDTQIKEAENKFLEKKNESISKTHEAEEVNKQLKQTIPGRVYREQFKEDEALLLIYLLDSHYVFLQEKGKEKSSFTKMVEENNYDLNIPVIGCAIGFPPIEDDPGGIYIQGDYDLKIDEDDNDEPDEIAPVILENFND